MKYTVEQFPKNKDIEVSRLSDEQIRVRRGARKYAYGDQYRCRCCHRDQPIVEFWVKDRKTGRRSTKCRDCTLRDAGVIEVGKSRFAMKVYAKGFRRCTVCKTIKPLSEYAKQRGSFGGVSNTCKVCAFELHKKFQIKQREEITEWYLRQRSTERGVADPSPEFLEAIRKEVEEERRPKFFIDGHSFVTAAAFARYIEDQYGILVSTTEKRLSQGYLHEECKLTETEARSAAHSKGAVKVTDTITKKVYIFKSTNDPRLKKMFSGDAVRKGIRTGQPTRVTSLSKHPNPCTFQRIPAQGIGRDGEAVSASDGTPAKPDPVGDAPKTTP